MWFEECLSRIAHPTLINQSITLAKRIRGRRASICANLNVWLVSQDRTMQLFKQGKTNEIQRTRTLQWSLFDSAHLFSSMITSTIYLIYSPNLHVLCITSLLIIITYLLRSKYLRKERRELRTAKQAATKVQIAKHTPLPSQRDGLS